MECQLCVRHWIYRAGEGSALVTGELPPKTHTQQISGMRRDGIVHRVPMEEKAVRHHAQNRCLGKYVLNE